MKGFEEFLAPTSFLDFNDPVFDDFFENVPEHFNSKEIAVWLYNQIRDRFIYDPYHLDLKSESLKASYIFTKNRAWCVEKAIVLAALARKMNIPSKLGFAVVTNHIGVDRLTNYLKRPEIVFHGFVSLYIEGKWVKCTPAFDQRICRISQVTPLEFDGENDSLFQAFEGESEFMEYNHFYGEFEDLPIQLMHLEMKKYYPHLFEIQHDSRAFSFKYDSKYLL
jgi:transglutaminase-like putative cysteine protease